MKHLNEQKLNEILAKIHVASVGIIADFCVDIYWHADMRLSELSRETPHYPLPIIEERMSLGSGGNVAANMKAIGLKNVYAVTVCGNDWRGAAMRKLISDAGICHDFIVNSDNFITPAYCKPLRKGLSETIYEDPRLDFENRSPLSKTDEDALIAKIKDMAGLADVIAVSDQFKLGIVTEKVRECINEIAISKTVIVDSRDRAARYCNAILKPNEVELFRIFNPDVFHEKIDVDTIVGLGRKLQKKNGKPVIITAGTRGAFIFEKSGFEPVPTIPEEPPVDIVGAGDTFLSALSACISAGASFAEAVEAAHLASGVTVKKLNTTGSVSPEELIAKYKERVNK